MQTKYQKPAACVGCPAYEWGVGFVPPEVDEDEPFEIAIVGQGPGEQEAAMGRPFVPFAPAGSVLRKWLRRSGVATRPLFIGNVVQCWLPKTKKGGIPFWNRDPTPKEIQFCWDAHVRKGLSASGGLVHIIPVGAPSTRFFLGLGPKANFERWTGVTSLIDLPEVSGV